MNPIALPRAPVVSPRVLAMAAVSLALHAAILMALKAPAWSVPARVALSSIEVSFAALSAPVHAPAARSTSRPAPVAAPAATPTTDSAPGNSATTQNTSDAAFIEARGDVAALNNPSPPYPLAARRRGIEGRVLLAAHVRADGACAEVQLKQTSGHELLDQAALDTVRRWRFLPATRGARAVDSWVDVPIRFRLDS